MRFLFLIILLCSLLNAHAFESLSYSGRLVKNDGSPVTGNANLTFELAYTNDLNNVLCTKDLDSVSLSQGVFHVKLDFSCPLNSILSNIPTGQSIAIRVIDRTSTIKAYSFQAIHSLPFSYMSQLSRQLAQMGATEGQILTWDAATSRWVPRNPAGTGNGSLTEIIAGTGLSGGTITSSGTIAIADSGVNTLQLADSAVNSAKILDSSIVNEDISLTANIAQSKIKDLVTDLGNKENTIASGSTAQYWRGDKSWQNLDASVRSARLLGYSIIPSMLGVSDGDTIQQALGKLEGQIIANDTAFDSSGQWNKNGVMISYSAGNVGIGIPAPMVPLDIKGEMRLNGTNSGYVGLAPAPDAGNTTYVLPSADGNAGEILTTNGSGVLNWTPPTAATTPDGNDYEIQFNLAGNFTGSSGLTWNESSGILNIGNTGDVTQLTFRGSTTNEIVSYPSGEMRIINSGNLNLQAPRVGIGTNSPSEKLSVAGNASIDGSLKLKDSGSNFVELKAPTTTAGVTYILPATLGTPGQALVVLDNSGALSWATPATDNASLANNSVTSDKIVDGTIVDADISSISVSKISGLSGALDGKEPSITAGITSQYWSGDKTWFDFDTSARNAKLSGYVLVDGSVSDGDTLQTAIAKIDEARGDYVLRNGTSIITGDFNLNSNKITNLADPVSAQDAATMGYVDSKATQWKDDGSDIYFNTGLVGINNPDPQAALDVKGTIRLTGSLSGYTGLAPAANAGSTIYTLPVADGLSGHVLKTNGAGVLSWGSLTSDITNLNATQISTGSIDNTEFGFLNGVNANIQTQINEKQNTTISGFSSVSFLQVINGDTVVDALGKLQGQVNVNQTTFNSTGHWGKNVDDIFFNSGNVGIGTNTPASKLHISGGDLTFDIERGIASTSGANIFTGPAGHTWYVQSGDPAASIFIGRDSAGATKFSFDATGSLSVDGLISSTLGGFRFPDGTVQTTASINTGLNNTMISGWPDAISCKVISPNYGQMVFYLMYFNYPADNRTYYRAYAGSTNLDIVFATSTKQFIAYQNLTTTECNFSIADLYTAGKAFNFVKGPAGQWLQNNGDAYYNAGKVGIGTSTPASSLEISNSGGSAMSVRDNNSLVTDNAFSTYIQGVDSAGTVNWYLGEGSPTGKVVGLMSAGPGYNLFLGTSGQQRVAVTEQGNVGIGVLAPSHPLSVNGHAQDGNDSTFVAKSRNNSDVFSILPWDGITYLGTGIRYQDGVWTHEGFGATSGLFAISGVEGGQWWASSNNSTTFNVASGIKLWTAAGVLVGSSSRDWKENFQHLDKKEVVKNINKLNISRWNYISEGEEVTHIGPIAEEWNEIFNTGEDNKHIPLIDEAGVALAGVQGLSIELSEAQARIEMLERENETLKKMNELILKRLEKLEQARQPASK